MRSTFWLAGRGTLHPWHGDAYQYQRVLKSGIFGALTFCPCLDISSIAPMERYVLGFWLAGWGALHLWHGNTDQHQRVLE